MDGRKVRFSGIQASGIPTLGNYLGAIRHWAISGAGNRDLFCVVDLHALTVRPDPALLRQRVRTQYALLLASGIDPSRALLFVQSHVAAHAELTWILSCSAMQGELSRMTQFKDKSRKHADNINAGLFTYPILMAADILLYDTNEVPVGDDQKQHVELCRDIALRFNHFYGDVFTVPEPVLPKLGARIMALQSPERKMDKSDPNPGEFISMLDDRDTIIKKCKRAVTDSETEVRYDPQTKPGVSNLMTIYALCTGKDMEAVERDFAGQGYGAFKTAVGEAVDAALAPIRRRTEEHLSAPAHLDKLTREQGDKASKLASLVLRRVKDAVGVS